VPAGFADGIDDVDDADADPGNELNTGMALVDGTLVLTDTGTVSADLSGIEVQRLVRQFVMASGESVSAGDLVTWMDGEAYGSAPRWGEENVFAAGGTNEFDMAALSATGFVVAYQDVGNSYHGTAITGTVSDGDVVWGSPSVFNAAGTYGIGVAALSETEFVVAYYDEGDGYSGTAIAGTVSSGGLFWGTESVFNPAPTYDIDVASMSGNEFVVAYRDSGNAQRGTAVAGTTSSGNLFWGTESVFNAGTTYEISVAALSSTDLVVAYQDMDNSTYGVAIGGTLSGGNLAWGTESVFNADSTSPIDVAALSPTDFIIGYFDSFSKAGTVITGTLDGGSLAWGDESIFDPWRAYDIGVAALSPTDVVIAYRAVDHFSHGTVIVGTIDGDGFAWGNGVILNTALTNQLRVVPSGAGEFVVGYLDGGNQSAGTVRVPNRIERRVIGTAKNAAEGGEAVNVLIGGVSDVHAGLTPGRVYYWQDDGSLGIATSHTRVGLAVSDTELILDQMWSQ
jgi:hypothetical protein